MSTGFTGSDTRSMGKFEREVEKRLDVFTEDFSPPGVSEKFPGSDFSKSDNNYQDKHADYRPEARRDFTLAASGRAEDIDDFDSEDHGIKKYNEQFPGSHMENFSDKVEKKLEGEIEKKLSSTEYAQKLKNHIQESHISGAATGVNGKRFVVTCSTQDADRLGKSLENDSCFKNIRVSEGKVHGEFSDIDGYHLEGEQSGGIHIDIDSHKDKPASDNPTVDVHATDPARLKSEVKKIFTGKPDPVMGIQSAKDKYMKEINK